ncbi:hypothetical protein SEA_ZOOMAN_262 [Microbacterium phage Zooman]|nr:hypothetical protein SEA_ZOOMAN_262 [Microbacterium phage Zooman]
MAKLTPEIKRLRKIAKAQAREAKQLDMRDYIQYHLDLYNLGKLVSVKGPERGGRHNDQSWFQLRVVYRSGPDAHHFDDGYIEVYLGYKQKGGYWNRRNIRLAIEKEANKKRDEQIVQKVWQRAQLSIEAGNSSRTSSGAIEL